MLSMRLIYCIFIIITALLVLVSCDSGSNEQQRIVVDFSGPTLESVGVAPQGQAPVLRAAVGAMISPKQTYLLYRDLFAYLSEQVNRRLFFVQRKTYREVNGLFGSGELDLGFVCTGPYASGSQKYGFELLATPEIDGSHFYHAYLIVGADSDAQEFEDLHGKTFAFTDPDSNTGYMVPLYWLQQLHATPRSFFARTLFTYSHDNSIVAVSQGLIDGASVDSLIWEHMAATHPEITSRTRVIKVSEAFGVPPVVAASSLPQDLRNQLQTVLLEMHTTAQGQKILSELKIDRFTVPQEGWYESIRQMLQQLQETGALDVVTQP